ncbi:MAG: MFS transporter [Nannocystaceae bacterium]
MRSSAAKLGLLASLYLAQGLPYGFFTQALPAMLRQEGVSLEGIGLSSLLALPWGLKFLWAPLVDRTGSRRFGRRRAWILPIQALTIVVLLGLATVDPRAGLQPVLVGVLLINLLAATQDIATDGLAVSLLSHGERGLGNGVQVAGYRMGMILGGGALLIVFDALGWPLIFAIMAAMVLVTTLPIGAYREPADEPEPARSRPTLTLLREFLRRPGMPLWLGVIAAFKAGEHFATGMLRPFFVDRGLDLKQIGLLTGTAGFIAALCGAMAGGALIGRIGRYRALFLFGVLQAIAVSAYALATLGPLDIPLLYGLCMVEHFVGGMATASLFTLMMDACGRGMEGSEYTFQASVVVLATGATSALAGYSASRLGYTWHFLISGIACVVTLLPLLAHVIREGQGRSKVMPWTG